MESINYGARQLFYHNLLLLPPNLALGEGENANGFFSEAGTCTVMHGRASLVSTLDGRDVLLS